jgi:hypothetical protein
MVEKVLYEIDLFISFSVLAVQNTPLNFFIMDVDYSALK